MDLQYNVLSFVDTTKTYNRIFVELWYCSIEYRFDEQEALQSFF